MSCLHLFFPKLWKTGKGKIGSSLHFQDSEPLSLCALLASGPDQAKLAHSPDAVYLFVACCVFCSFVPYALPPLGNLGSHPDSATNSHSLLGHSFLFYKPVVKGGCGMGPGFGGPVGSCLLPSPSEAGSHHTGQKSRERTAGSEGVLVSDVISSSLDLMQVENWLAFPNLKGMAWGTGGSSQGKERR